MKNLIIILTAFIIAFAGCKDKITQPPEFTNKNLLHKIYSDPNSKTYTEYLYNSSYKLITVKSYNNGALERTTDYEYDKDQKIIKESTFHTYFGEPEYAYLTNEYDGQGLLTKSFAYLKMSDGTYEHRSTITYTYDDKKRLITASIFNTDSVKTKYTELIYNDDGNVIETNFYQDNKLSFNDKYEYDKMNNPLKLRSASISCYTISKNNVVKHTQINYMMENDDSIIQEYSYEYNPSQYPISYSNGSQKFYFEYY